MTHSGAPERILVMDRAGRFYTGDGRFTTYLVNQAVKFKTEEEAREVADLYFATVVKV